jgi:uncharacterized protein (TIGR03435 family)
MTIWMRSSAKSIVFAKKGKSSHGRDQTGLTGTLELRLGWTPASAEWVAPPIPGVALAPRSGGASIFTAIQEQPGLKLEPSRGPVEFLVIDRAELPSEN